AYIVEPVGRSHDLALFIDARAIAKRSQTLRMEDPKALYSRRPGRFSTLPGQPLIYWWSDQTLIRLAGFARLENNCVAIGKGAGPHALFYRLRWEVNPNL